MNDENPDNSGGKTNKLVAVIIPVLGILLILFIKRFTFKDKDFSEVLSLTSREVNKICPKMEDKDTRLEGTEILHDKVFQYNYTLLDVIRDSVEVEMLYVSFEAAMLDNAKTNPSLELFRKNNVTLAYNFKDRLGNFLTRIKITPERYKN